MIGDQVKCFRVGPCIATPWDLRQKKKSNKNKLVAVGRESREEPKVKSQLLVLLLIKFPAYIKSSLGS